MGVLPLTDPHMLALVCDCCHRGMGGTTAHITAWSILWRIAVDRDWSGSADSGGPHRCPGCTGGRGLSAAPSHTSLLVHLQAVGTAAVVRLTGDLDGSVTDDLRAVLDHTTEDYTHLVLDLRGVQVVDSTALGLFVRAHQRLKPRGGRVLLAAPSRWVRVVLHTMHLEVVFPIVEDAGAALDRIGGHVR